MSDVFLSYSHRDTPVARRLFQQLVDAGVDTFWDREIPLGMHVRDEVSSAIAAARIFVLLQPVQYGPSDFNRIETQAAISRSLAGDMQLIPVLLPGRSPAGDIGTFQSVRAESEYDFDSVVDLIVRALRIAPRQQQSGEDRRLSLLSSLLDSDLESAPQAAAIVIDEIASSSLASTPRSFEREVDLLYRAADWAQRNLGSDHPSHPSIHYQLNAALLQSERYSEVVSLSAAGLERARTAKQKIEVGLQLGNALFQIGQFEAAAVRYQQVLELAQRNDSPSALTTCLVALGSVARSSGDLDRAESLYARALEVSARFLQPSARVSALIGLREIAAQRGDIEAERRWAGEARWLSRTSLAPDDPLALRAAALHKTGNDK